MSAEIIYLLGVGVTALALIVTAGYLGLDGFYETFGIRNWDDGVIICSLMVVLWPFPVTLAVCSIPYFIGKAARKYRDRPRVPKARAL